MGFFSGIVSGVTNLIQGSKNRKNDAQNRAHAEKMAQQQSARALQQRQHELKMASIRSADLRAQAELEKNNKTKFIPYVIGGGVALLGGILIIFKKK